MRTIKNQFGVQIPIQNIFSGVITTDMDFDDYGLYIGTEYKVHNGTNSGPCIYGTHGGGETILHNNELRDDVLERLTITI